MSANAATSRKSFLLLAILLVPFMAVAETRLIEGFGAAEIPSLRARFSDAREKLEALAR